MRYVRAERTVSTAICQTSLTWLESIKSILPIRNMRRYSVDMPLPPSKPNFDVDLPDLDLPVLEVPLLLFHDLPPDWTYAINEHRWKTQVLDDAYWAESLAGKNPEPFVM